MSFIISRALMYQYSHGYTFAHLYYIHSSRALVYSVCGANFMSILIHGVHASKKIKIDSWKALTVFKYIIGF